VKGRFFGSRCVLCRRQVNHIRMDSFSAPTPGLQQNQRFAR
jgi:hypothetical protein